MLASVAAAQTSTMSLTQVLAANNSTLSMLNSLLATQPTLTNMLTMAKDITILAPSNDAFSKWVQNPTNKMAASNSAMLAMVLEYHVLNGTHPSSAFTTTMNFIPSMLKGNMSMSMGSMNMMNMTMTMVTGGQVVGGIKSGNKVELMSGLKEISTVQTADIMFSGGVLHIIDTVLTVPMAPSTSAIDSQLTALAGALKKTNLLTAVDSLRDVTIFAPSNAAFQAIGSAANTLTEQQLAAILEYHIINGTVGYSSLLTTGLANQSYPTLGGGEVKIEAVGGKVFVNSAQVVITDVLVSNGVMHVVNNVLNPANSTATPNPTATTQPIVFAGVSSATSVPFTSGISVTTTAPSASTKTAAAGRVEGQIGAVGVAALLGVVAAL
ncbi:FAS1 domain-containing protein [Tricladium varicosporioides]|nr:FAS1 domain-containing protein [Hymenoscyphus varicosporioides]